MTDWLTSAQATLDSENTGWTNYTIRQIIESSQLSNQGLQYVRVTWKAPSTIFTLNNAYIGHVASSGDPYDWEAAPTQLLFAGVAGFTISPDATIISDPQIFSISPSKNLMIAFQAGSSALKRLVTLTGWRVFWKNANDATTVDATGYTEGANVISITKVESGYDPNNGLLPYY